MGYVIGCNPLLTFTAAELASSGKGFGLGDRATDHLGREFVFVLAGSGGFTGDGYVGIIDESYGAVMASLTTSATAFGDLVGVAQTAIAASSYGWLLVKGPTNVQVAASCAANVLLNTTATAGQLDDDSSAGAEDINGLVLTTARGGTAGVAAGVANYPTVGATGA